MSETTPRIVSQTDDFRDERVMGHWRSRETRLFCFSAEKSSGKKKQNPRLAWNLVDARAVRVVYESTPLGDDSVVGL